MFESHQFSLAGLAHSEARSGLVGIKLTKMGEPPWCLILSVEDAQRLVDMLPTQISIAGKKKTASASPPHAAPTGEPRSSAPASPPPGRSAAPDRR
jgi:hypothetical protein